MAVFLAILKWIGIVAGGFIGLVILLTVLVVCIPVRYRLLGNNRDVIEYSFRVSWMWRMVSIVKKMNSDAVWLRIFGIPVRCLAGGKEKSNTELEDGEKTKTGHKPEKETQPMESLESEQTRTEIGQASSYHKESKKKKRKPKKKSNSSRKKSFSFTTLSSIIKFVRAAENQYAFRVIGRELRQLIRYLAPRRVRGRLVIGTGDPSSTGLVIGGISLFPFAYQEGVTIIPNFEEKILQAEGVIQGKMHVLYFLRLCIRLYRDRELRKVWNHIQKWKKEAA